MCCTIGGVHFDREKLKQIFAECDDLKITEKLDISSLEPYFAIWDGATKIAFVNRVNSIENRVADERKDLKETLEALKDYFTKIKITEDEQLL